MVVLESEKKSPKMHYLLVTESPTQTDLNSEDILFFFYAMYCICLILSYKKSSVGPDAGVQHLFWDSLRLLDLWLAPTRVQRCLPRAPGVPCFPGHSH